MKTEKKNIVSKKKVAKNKNNFILPNDDFLKVFELKDEKEILEELDKKLIKEFNLIEGNIYLYDNINSLLPAQTITTAVGLDKYLTYYTEQGLLDWAISQKQVVILPNLLEPMSTKIKSILVIPIVFFNQIQGFYFGLLLNEKNSYTQENLKEIQIIFNLYCLIYLNIKKLEEINNLNNRIILLNKHLLDYSRVLFLEEQIKLFSYEIISPLEIMKANLNLLQLGIGDSTRRIEIIKEQIEKLEKINYQLNQILTYREERNNYEKINLIELLNEIISFSEHQFQKEAINIIKEFKSECIEIVGNKSQLEQVFLTLFLFAWYSMPEGGTLTIDVDEIQMNKIQIIIADTGIGLSEEETAKLFDDNTILQDKRAQLSFALSMVKNIIHQHKGNINVISQIGKGTTFRINFKKI